jgi:hypothetical protein
MAPSKSRGVPMLYKLKCKKLGVSSLSHKGEALRKNSWELSSGSMELWRENISSQIKETFFLYNFCSENYRQMK